MRNPVRDEQEPALFKPRLSVTFRACVCEAGDCTWLFMDLSKNRSRRWCDMKYCGNRAKSRRHYERKRAAVSG